MSVWWGLFLVLVSCTFRAYVTADLVNLNIVRLVDVRTQVETNVVEIQFQNLGPDPVTHYELAFSDTNTLAYLEVLNMKGKMLKVERGTGNEGPIGVTLISVELDKALASKAAASIKLKYAYIRTISNLPAEITSQSQNHLAYYETSEQLLSPYFTTKQLLKIQLPSTRVESYTETDGASHKGDVITYVSESTPKFATSKVAVHFPTQYPFDRLQHVTKTVEVSMWGNVEFEEIVDLVNDGPKFIGSYSRLDFQRSGFVGGGSTRGVSATLVPQAQDIYYRDEIGNISTSFIQRDEYDDNSLITVQLLSRFPLFGGWKTNFKFGYNVPAQFLVSKVIAPIGAKEDLNRFVLNITFGSSLLTTVADEAFVKIMLPEGATDIELVAPFGFDEEKTTISYNFLDLTGHPTLELVKKNLVSYYHARHVQVYYSVSPQALWMKPLVVSGAFFILFLFAMIVSRIDFSIASENGEKTRK